MARAQCLCGDVVWEVEPPFQFVHDCHCRRCQKSHGTASGTVALAPTGRLRFVRGADAVAHYATSASSRRAFCRRCGSPLPTGDDFGGLTFFPIGPLEGEFDAPSAGHIFGAAKAPWHDLCDDLPVWDAFPPGVDAPVLDELVRAAPAAGRLGASCLCGALRWELEGKPLLARRCHCWRCRRARASSHAANALWPRQALHWSGGRERLVTFKLPEAERFSQAFCAECGGKAPWLVEVRDAWNVPLGSLDGDPGVKPCEHIFVASKAPWLEIRDGLPQHEGYSPN